MGGEGHDGYAVEEDGEGGDAVGEGVVEEEVLCSCFAEVDRRVVGLVAI